MATWSRDGDGRLVVVAAGEVDMAVADELSATIEKAIVNEPDATQLVFDLGDVTFMDSTGINCLVLALKRMQDRDGSVSVENAAPHVAKVIRLVGLAARLALPDDAG